MYENAIIKPIILYNKKKMQPGVMAKACNPSTWEAEAGGF
jgi:hypothetical protein